MPLSTQGAWHALADMWPPADFDRIRASILNARARGIRSQVDDVSSGPSQFHSKKFAYVYDTETNTYQTTTDLPGGAYPRADTRPQPILLRRPPPVGVQVALPDREELIDLVIDAAGKGAIGHRRRGGRQ